MGAQKCGQCGADEDASLAPVLQVSVDCMLLVSLAFSPLKLVDGVGYQQTCVTGGYPIPTLALTTCGPAATATTTKKY